MAVVVVNAEQLLEQRDVVGTFEDQVSSADLLLLNKVDLVPQESLASLEAVLSRMAPDTPVVQTIRGQVDSSVLFPPVLRDVRTQRRSAGGESTRHRHESFLSYELAVEDGIEPDVLIERLRSLGVLRGKGFVRTADGLRLVQGVGRRIELTEVQLAPPAVLIGRVVVITGHPEKSGYHHSADTSDLG
jgi:cobalamin biosynthesis protein CobW